MIIIYIAVACYICSMMQCLFSCFFSVWFYWSC